MRPKFLSLFAVTALVLTGCASADTSTPVSATDDPSAPQEAAPAETPSPEEAFVDYVESQIAGKEDVLAEELPAVRLTEKYWLERGEVYCEELATGTNGMPKETSATAGQFEIILMGAASGTLCPQS